MNLCVCLDIEKQLDAPEAKAAEAGLEVSKASPQDLVFQTSLDAEEEEESHKRFRDSASTLGGVSSSFNGNLSQSMEMQGVPTIVVDSTVEAATTVVDSTAEAATTVEIESDSSLQTKDGDSPEVCYCVILVSELQNYNTESYARPGILLVRDHARV